MTPARAGSSAKGSIMRCWCAMRRIQRSDLMDMVAQYIGAIDTYATRSVDKGPTTAVRFGGLSEFFHERDDPTLRVLPAAVAAGVHPDSRRGLHLRVEARGTGMGLKRPGTTSRKDVEERRRGEAWPTVLLDGCPRRFPSTSLLDGVGL